MKAAGDVKRILISLRIQKVVNAIIQNYQKATDTQIIGFSLAAGVGYFLQISS
jgi:hypothetical protein